jgi:hypothetical protein
MVGNLRPFRARRPCSSCFDDSICAVVVLVVIITTLLLLPLDAEDRQEKELAARRRTFQRFAHSGGSEGSEAATLPAFSRRVHHSRSSGFVRSAPETFLSRFWLPASIVLCGPCLYGCECERESVWFFRMSCLTSGFLASAYVKEERLRPLQQSVIVRRKTDLWRHRVQQ